MNDGLSGAGAVFGCGLGEDTFLAFRLFVFSGEARLIQETADLALVKATKHGFEQQTAEKNRVLV